MRRVDHAHGFGLGAHHYRLCGCTAGKKVHALKIVAVGNAGGGKHHVAGGKLFVFDAGDGTTETLARMGLQVARVEAVFLMHFHSDHIDGLGGLAVQRWATSASTAPIPLYGDEGVERIANGLREAYALDASYRIAHHGEAVVPSGGEGYAARPFAIISRS